MKKNGKFKRLIDKYFSRELDMQVQVFNLLAVVGIFSGIVISAITILVKESVVTSIADFSVAVLSFIMMRYAYKTKRYLLCSRLFVIIIFFIMFPILFFSCGGYKSGVLCIFIIAFLFTTILLGKRERNIAITIEMAIYFTCCLVVYYKPETASVLESETEYFIMSMFNFVTSCTITLIVLLMRVRISDNHQKLIEELNRELTARNETLTRYDDMKSDFLATVAHEINTPLAIISASASDTLDILNETPLNTDEITENQQLIERRVKLIDNILLDLMDTVAIENGRISLNRQPVDIAGLIRNVCSVQHNKIDRNDNTVEYDLQPGLPQLWADPSRIEQVMVNLLSNAFHHTRGGTVKIGLKHENGKQIIFVKDDGEGMDAETRRIILKQYVSTKADYWRHGIGLFVCRRIIDAHGGDIWIESEKERGTTVSFSLSEDPEYE